MGIFDKLLNIFPAGRAINIASKLKGKLSSAKPAAEAPSAEAGFFGQMDAEAPVRAPEQSLREKYAARLRGVGSGAKGRINNWWERRKATKEEAAGAEPRGQEQQRQSQPQQGEQQQQAPAAQPSGGGLRMPGLPSLGGGPASTQTDGGQKTSKLPAALVIIVILIAGFLGRGYIDPVMGLGKQAIISGKVQAPGQIEFLSQLFRGETISPTKVESAQPQEDIGLRLEDVRPELTVYTDPKKVAVIGTISAVSPTEDFVDVKVVAKVDPLVLSAFGFSGSSLNCKLVGLKTNRVKTKDLQSQPFRCDLPVANIGGILGGEFEKDVPVKVEATISNTKTWTKKIIYFANPNELRSIEGNRLAHFGIAPDLLVPDQSGDLSVKLGVELASDPTHKEIVATSIDRDSQIEYLLKVKPQSRFSSTGAATPSSLALYIESPPANIIDPEHFACEPVQATRTTKAGYVCKPVVDLEELGPGKDQELVLRFVVPDSALKGTSSASFEALAVMQYEYTVPKEALIKIKTKAAVTNTPT